MTTNRTAPALLDDLTVAYRNAIRDLDAIITRTAISDEDLDIIIDDYFEGTNARFQKMIFIHYRTRLAQAPSVPYFDRDAAHPLDCRCH